MAPPRPTSSILDQRSLNLEGEMPMQLSETEAQQLDAILDQYDRHPAVQQMRQYIQHGSVTTYEHCRNVVLVSYWLNRRLHLGRTKLRLLWGRCCMIFICMTGIPPAVSMGCAACLRCTASLIRSRLA